MESVILGMEDETIELNTKLQHDQSVRITEREVWEAANGLWAKKIDPSSNKVRELLGNRGSFRTIQLYLESWRRQQIEQPSLDDPLWQELTKMRKKYQQQSALESSKKIKEIEQEYEHKVIELQELYRNVEIKYSELQKQFETVQNNLASLSESHQTLRDKLTEEIKKCYLLEQLNQNLTKEIQETKYTNELQISAMASEHNKSLSDLQNKYEQSQNRFEEKIKILEKKYAEQEQSTNNQILTLSLKNQELEHILVQTKNKEKIFIAESEKLKATNNDIENDNVKLKKEIQELKTINIRIEKNEAIAHEKLIQENLKVEDLKQNNKELQTHLLNYSVKIGQLEEKIDVLKRSSKQINHKLK